MKFFRHDPMIEDQYGNCGFTEDTTCLAEACWHGVLLAPHQQTLTAMMQACEEHRDIMAAQVHYVHAFGEHCNLPGSMFCWPANECVLTWDENEIWEQAA